MSLYVVKYVDDLVIILLNKGRKYSTIHVDFYRAERYKINQDKIIKLLTPFKRDILNIYKLYFINSIIWKKISQAKRGEMKKVRDEIARFERSKIDSTFFHIIPISAGLFFGVETDVMHLPIENEKLEELLNKIINYLKTHTKELRETYASVKMK
jgi:hypothetical protein